MCIMLAFEGRGRGGVFDCLIISYFTQSTDFIFRKFGMILSDYKSKYSVLNLKDPKAVGKGALC